MPQPSSLCQLCPHRCEVDRSQGGVRRCRAGSGLTIASIMSHPGEEPCLGGWAGSGMLYTT